MSGLVDAAEEAGVGRFVYRSYAGVDAGIGTPIERAKVAIEWRLQRSSMRSVIVRPDAFQEIHLGPLARFDMATFPAAAWDHSTIGQRVPRASGSGTLAPPDFAVA